MMNDLVLKRKVKASFVPFFHLDPIEPLKIPWLVGYEIGSYTA
jgi:hypothetical protein